MSNGTKISGYAYSSSDGSHTNAYLFPAIERLIAKYIPSDKRVFDLGCGNGSVAHWLSSKGFQVTGVDPSETGIEMANKAYPEHNLQVGSCYEPLEQRFGQFPLVVSLEVVEHVYAPRDYARCVYSLLQPNGFSIISTPYHGYIKNLSLAITNKLDSHFTALWDHGHIKFWSIRTLTTLLSEAGLTVKSVERVGRIAPLAKSMIFLVQKL
jgi:2-polyprenyl-3-methyl-5-hydroxy-6-metoxy-1,4-benzoquinol methylase